LRYELPTYDTAWAYNADLKSRPSKQGGYILRFLLSTLGLDSIETFLQVQIDMMTTPQVTIPVITSKEDMRAWTRQQKKDGKRVGFVPTMVG
jgi:hypothetical protein